MVELDPVGSWVDTRGAGAPARGRCGPHLRASCRGHPWVPRSSGDGRRTRRDPAAVLPPAGSGPSTVAIGVAERRSVGIAGTRKFRRLIVGGFRAFGAVAPALPDVDHVRPLHQPVDH